MKEKDYKYLTTRLRTLLTRQYANMSYRLDNIAYFAGLIIKDHFNLRVDIAELYKPEPFKGDKMFSFHLGGNVYMFLHKHKDSVNLTHLFFFEKAAGELGCMNYYLKDDNRLLRGFWLYYNENTKKLIMIIKE